MKFAFASNPDWERQYMAYLLKIEAVIRPAIPFYEDQSGKLKKEEVAPKGDDNKNDANVITVECKLDPNAVGNDAKTYKKKDADP